MSSKLEMAECIAPAGGFAPPCESHNLDVGGRSIHVRSWRGDPARTVVIWHGITGTGSDHEVLARRLSSLGYQVLAPDSIGCGQSDWALDKAAGYGLTALAEIAVAILDSFGLERVAWLGVSKGGGLGIRVAAEKPARIAALALWDVGPGLPESFRAGLAKRLATPPRADSMLAFRAQIARMLERSEVKATNTLVDRLAAAWSRRLDDGGVGYHYDPGLSQQFLNCPEDFDLWPFWDRIACPTLVLKGEHSDILPDAELQVMLQRNAGARSVVLAKSGHINFLEDDAHQDVLLTFFESAL